MEKLLNSEDWRVRLTAVESMKGRDVPLEWIERALMDEDCRVRRTAAEAMQGRDVPLRWIERALMDEDCRVRLAAVKAMKGREVPLELIERALRDKDWRVRHAAVKAMEGRDVSLEWNEKHNRTYNPPNLVYKKCVGDVIVVAHIPDDAIVRGSLTTKSRANKAEIIDVIGEVEGMNIGISYYDPNTIYRNGDVIEVDDFDTSFKECSTGFHFFCDIEMAKEYFF